MKQIAPNYTYNKTTGVITLTGVYIDRDQLLLIVNTTRNVIYYNFADSATTLQAFTQGNPYSVPATNTSLTLNSAVVSASSAHANADTLVIYYDDQLSGANVTANIGISELPYIKVNINIENVNGALTSNVYLRRISEYCYESIRYQGNEDEAYLKVVLEVPESSQKVWRLYSYGAYADVQGSVAFIFPQNAGSNNGDALPPKTGWTLETGITGTLSISYEQPATQTVTALDLGVKADAVATTDTGTFSVISFIKRGLQNWTSLLAKIPTLVSGRIPVDGSGVTQPISGTVTANTGLTQPLTDTQLRATAVSVSTIPAQGTTVSLASFTSTTPSTSLVSTVAGRKVLTVFNEGAGVLYISAGGSCTTTSYQVRLGAGDYWECPAGQLSQSHVAVFGTTGSAKVTQVT